MNPILRCFQLVQFVKSDRAVQITRILFQIVHVALLVYQAHGWLEHDVWDLMQGLWLVRSVLTLMQGLWGIYKLSRKDKH